MDHPYASFVHKVQKPGRYLGGEHGSRTKDWGSVEARVCLAFPDVYDIGMSHLGFKILYKILNDDPRTLAERAYAPWIDMEAELRARGLPLVYVRERAAAVGLRRGRLLAAVRADVHERPDDARPRRRPAAVAGARRTRTRSSSPGGPTATHPEPLAPFLDAVVIGDGEERATEIALAWTAMKRQGLPRAERLRGAREAARACTSRRSTPPGSIPTRASPSWTGRSRPRRASPSSARWSTI